MRNDFFSNYKMHKNQINQIKIRSDKNHINYMYIQKSFVKKNFNIRDIILYALAFSWSIPHTHELSKLKYLKSTMTPQGQKVRKRARHIY